VSLGMLHRGCVSKNCNQSLSPAASTARTSTVPVGYILAAIAAANAGRMLSAFAPTLVGALSISSGIAGVLAALSISFLGGALSIFLLPGTKGRELTGG
jgi:hypothetical protein